MLFKAIYMGIFPLSSGLTRTSPTFSKGNGSFYLVNLPPRRRALPHGNLGLAEGPAGSRGALWEDGKMAAPVGRTLLGVAKGWRQLDRLWAGRSRGLSLEAAPSSSRSPWRLSGALCLQRPPLITKPLTPLQEEMAGLLQQVRQAGTDFVVRWREAAEPRRS